MSHEHLAVLPKITFVTGNKNKLREVQQILAGTVVVDSERVDLPELQGDPMEIAKVKATTAFGILQRPCMVEDTSLCFDALANLPGPYIKWFLDGLGHEGLNKMLDGFAPNRKAHALCIFTVAVDKDTVLHFVGRCHGEIKRPQGPDAFGWDPIFFPTDGGHDGSLSFAQMGPAEKNKISHRFNALNELMTALKDPDSAVVRGCTPASPASPKAKAKADDAAASPGAAGKKREREEHDMRL